MKKNYALQATDDAGNPLNHAGGFLVTRHPNKRGGIAFAASQLYAIKYTEKSAAGTIAILNECDLNTRAVPAQTLRQLVQIHNDENPPNHPQ